MFVGQLAARDTQDLSSCVEQMSHCCGAADLGSDE